MEMIKFNYMLEIDILRNSSPRKVGVLRGAFEGFGCAKRHPDALLAKTMPDTPLLTRSRSFLQERWKVICKSEGSFIVGVNLKNSKNSTNYEKTKHFINDE